MVKYRIRDNDNGNHRWGPWAKAKIPRHDDPTVMAQRVNLAALIACSGEPAEEAPGEVIAAAGDGDRGIAWVNDHGHQGATSLVIEWVR